MTARILIGDCRETLRQLPDASVDSVVCDPPYHLTSIVKRFGAANAAPAKVGKTGAYARASKGFMGQTWDGGDVAFQPETWAEVLRVLKPGGHIVAFSGTRTYHRMVCAIEDAGFEIRDQLAWVYGSGFPKSHNQPGGWGTALKPAWEPICLARKPLISTVAANVLAHGTGAINVDGCRIGTEGARNNGRQAGTKGIYGHIGATERVDYGMGRWPANILHDGSDEVLAGFPETSSGTRAAGEHGGMGFHGSGSWEMPGVNGDSGSAARYFYCAKTTTEERNRGLDSLEHVSIVGEWENADLNLKLRVDTDQYPPKVIAVSGTPTSDAIAWNTWLFGSESEGRSLPACRFTMSTETNSTTASRTWRFLARSITSESIADAKSGEMTGGSPVANAEIGTQSVTITSGSMAFLPGVGPAPSGVQLRISASVGTCDHPTVKPQALMQWLCRLITPPGGTVLDPFMGSGSTGIAADAEQFNFIGCELSPDYAAIAERRIRDAAGMFADVQVAA